MKANIWGKEVNCCEECRLFANNNWCNSLNREISLVDDINPDCNFLKPVTKKFIESLGFIYDEPFQDKYNYPADKYIKPNIAEIYVYNNTEYRIAKFVEFEDNISGYRSWYDLVFKGKIHNQEHFKFILKGLGV